MMYRKIPEQVWTRWAPACGIVAVMLYYGLFLCRNAINVPYHDDVLDVLQFLSRVVESSSARETFGHFFINYNEHRTLVPRLMYYLAFLVEGEIDFRTLVFLANLAVPLLLLTLYLAIRKHPHALLVLLPAALVLFQPRFYGLSFFSMSAFAFMFVYLYGFACFLCLRQVTVSRFLAAMVFACLGTFSLASGQIIWLVGLISLLHQALLLRRRSLAYAGCWCACAVLILAVWRIDYQTSNSLGQVVANLLGSPVHNFLYFLVLTGDALSDASVLLAACGGGVLVSLICYWSVRSFKEEDISLYLFAWYILLTTAAMTIGRAAYLNLDYALESRLTFPSVLLLVTTIVIFLSRIPASGGNKRYGAVTVLACLYWGFSYLTYPASLQSDLEERVKFFNAGRYWVIPYPIKETNNIVREAIDLGIYRPPARPLPKPDAAPKTRLIRPPFSFRNPH